MRSTAKEVLPVLVGPRTAVNGDRAKLAIGDMSEMPGRSASPLCCRKRRVPALGVTYRLRRTAHRRKSRSEEHTSELQSLMRISYAVFCLKKKNTTYKLHTNKPKYK